jgi:hypothetical protein
MNMCGTPLGYCDDILPFRPPCVFTTMNQDHNLPSCGSWEDGDEHTTNCDPEDDPDDQNYLAQNSVLWAEDDTSNPLDDFPGTTVHVILGTMDSGQGPVGGLSFYDQLDSRKRLWLIQNGNHDWPKGSSHARRALKFAIEYFSRPWVGDVDYSGTIDVEDYNAIAANYTSSPQCQVAPNPDTDAPNYDVNNDGNVNDADKSIVATTAGCTPGDPPSCTSPVSLETCDEPGSVDGLPVINKAWYPSPESDSEEDEVDCSGEAPPSQCGFTCGWCDFLE